MPGVVLDPRAVADLEEQLAVVPRSRLEPLRLERFTLPLQLVEALAELLADAVDGTLDFGLD
jgi:hypothetical protein